MRRRKGKRRRRNEEERRAQARLWRRAGKTMEEAF